MHDQINVGSGFFDFIMREGWHGVEEWGTEHFRWMEQRAELLIPLGEEKLSAMDISVYNNFEGQILTVYVNDLLVSEIHIEQDFGTYRINLEDLLLQEVEDNLLLISFVCSEAFVPAQLDASSADYRELGIAFCNILFS